MKVLAIYLGLMVIGLASSYYVYDETEDEYYYYPDRESMPGPMKAPANVPGMAPPMSPAKAPTMAPSKSPSMSPSMPPAKAPGMTSTMSPATAPMVKKITLGSLISDWIKGTTLRYATLDIAVSLMIYFMWVIFATILTTNVPTGRSSSGASVPNDSTHPDAVTQWILNSVEHLIDSSQ